VYGLSGYDFAALDLALRHGDASGIGDPDDQSLAMSKPGLAIAEGVSPVWFFRNVLQHNIAVSIPDPESDALNPRDGDIRFVVKDSIPSIDGVVVPQEAMIQSLDVAALPRTELQDPHDAMRYAERTLEHLGRLGAVRLGQFEDQIAYVEAMRDQGRYLNLQETADLTGAAYGAYANHAHDAYGVEVPTPAHLVKLMFEMNRPEQNEPTLYVYGGGFRTRMAQMAARQ
jgi:hypothetical protein